MNDMRSEHLKSAMRNINGMRSHLDALARNIEGASKEKKREPKDKYGSNLHAVFCNIKNAKSTFIAIDPYQKAIVDCLESLIQTLISEHKNA